ncbi:MAG: TIGR02594 family protein [Gammaproteobacteria bacterium]|nr:MAG: TIGR02594 family protein [Gammaproteobacteria bacterium]
MGAILPIVMKILGMLPWGKILEMIMGLFGDTEKVLTSKMKIETKPRKKKYWMTLAKAEIGVTEIPGERNEKRVLEYHNMTTLRATEDSVPWCASFVSAILEWSGEASTRSARAKSYLTWGYELAEPMYGCIVVLWRKSPDSASGHVGFYCGEDESGRILLLGGNQNNQVCITPYSKERVLSYRMPEGKI